MNIRGGTTAVLEACSVGVSTALINRNFYYHPDLGVIRYSTTVNARTSLIGYKIGDKQGGDISPIGSDTGEPIIDNIAPSNYFAQQITLHPNPTHDRFLLQLQNPKRQNLTLEVADIHGRTILSQEILEGEVEVNLSDSSNGIYLVQLSDGKHWWTEKVVKY